MTNNEPTHDPRIWDRLDRLTDDELASLVASATTVLADGSDDAETEDYLAMPARSARGEIARSLQEAGLQVDEAGVARITGQDDASRQVTIELLRSLAQNPRLAAEIEAVHRARGGMMVIDPLTISAMALLLLVLKLKRIKVGRSEVTFYEAKQGMLKTIRGLVGN